MVACGVGVFAADLRASEAPAVFTVGFCLAYLHIGVVGQLFLSFPAAWPHRRAERVAVVFGYVAAVGSQLTRYVADHPRPPWSWGMPQPTTVAARVGSLLAVMIVVLVAALLARRWRRASPPARRELAVLSWVVPPAGALGLLAALASAASAPQAVVVLLAGGFAVVGALLPFAFLAGLLRVRPAGGRVADDALQHVQDSRQRLALAAFGERRLIQRDLHDGMQQRLLALLITLDRARSQLAGADPGDPALAAAAEWIQQAFDQLDTAVSDLRDLTQAIYPATLVDQGLAAALEPLAERAPLPVDLRVPPDRWAPEVETTAYFVIMEALAYVYRHAHATRATVAVAARGDHLVVEVSDDGVGGATRSWGTGLRNLEDRAAAVGGELAVHSPPGAGTRISARLPVQPP
jgi:signal transduction histidine kinase